VGENLARLGLAARLAAADVADRGTWWDGEPFERILADVPCTASGIVRRHPDIKWLRRQSDIAGFVAQQQRLLDALCLAGGGGILCATARLPRENEDQIEAFLARHADAAPVELALPEDTDLVGGRLLPAAGRAGTITTGFLRPPEGHRRLPPRALSTNRFLALLCLTAAVARARRRRGHDSGQVGRVADRGPDVVLNACSRVVQPDARGGAQKGLTLYFVLEFELTHLPALVGPKSSSNRCSTASPTHR
jgi:hypothetical protein